MFKESLSDSQKTLFDLDHHFSPVMQERLSRTWADEFYLTIFCQIDEQPYHALYSEQYSRPNTPVRLMVSLLILKELNQLTDDELLDALCFDFRYQFALGLTDPTTAAVSPNTLTHFRNRLVAHTISHGQDLLQETLTELTFQLMSRCDLSQKVARMDSMMIASSCQRLSRLSLIFKVIQRLVKVAIKLEIPLPKAFDAFGKSNSEATLLYNIHPNQEASQLEKLIQAAVALLDWAKTDKRFFNQPAFSQLKRLIDEQTIEVAPSVLVPIKGVNVASTSLQNPTDSDATYRTKAGEDYVGYVLNFCELRDIKGTTGFVFSSSYQPNIYSDTQFGQDFCQEARRPEGLKEIAVDGAYYSNELVELAKEQHLHFNFSQLTGRKQQKEWVDTAMFEFDHSTRTIIACPKGHRPIKSTYYDKVKTVTAKFSKEQCVNCPLITTCYIKEQTKEMLCTIKDSKRQTDAIRKEMRTESSKALANYRAGVEGIPSVLRRRYKINEIPVMGLVRSKIWIIAKLMAHNFNMYLNHQKLVLI